MPETNYIPRPWVECLSPAPCPDPCTTEAVRLNRQTQCLPCVEQPFEPPDEPEIVNLLTDLAAYWKMEEPTGAGPPFTRYDSHDSLDLAPFYDAQRVSGKIGYATAFSGDPSSYLYNNNIVFISDNKPLSVSAWVNVQSTSVDQTILGSVLPSLPVGWRLWYDSSLNRIKLTIYNGAFEYSATSATPVVVGTWYHVVGTLAMESIKLYTNASAVTMLTGVWPDDTSPGFRVGSDLDDNTFTGYVDEVGFWSERTLSAADVAFLYNGGNGITYPFA